MLVFSFGDLAIHPFLYMMTKDGKLNHHDPRELPQFLSFTNWWVVYLAQTLCYDERYQSYIQSTHKAQPKIGTTHVMILVMLQLQSINLTK